MMIIVRNEYICGSVANKVARLNVAHLLIKFLGLKCNLEDYDLIKIALQDFIDKTQYSGSLNKSFNMFDFKVLKAEEIVKKYGTNWTQYKIFATKKSLFLKYSEQNFLKVDFDTEQENEN